MRRPSLPVALSLAGTVFATFLVACGKSDAAPPELSAPDEIPAPARSVLEEADSFEILALDPGPPAQDPVPDAFHGYDVLGRTTIVEELERKRLVHWIYKGIESSDGTVAACFNPRHGVHAVKDGKTVDLVICYQCLSMKIHVDGREASSANTSQGSRGRINTFYETHGLTIAE